MEESLDDYTTNEILTLVSLDNQTFEIEKSKVQICDYLQTLTFLDSTQLEIPIKLNGDLLKIVVDFMEFYETKPYDRIQKPVPKHFRDCCFINDNRNETFKEIFYTNLINIQDKKVMMYFVHMINYLGIQPLLDLVCAKIANIIRDMSTDEETKNFLQVSNSDYNEMKKIND